MSGGFGKDPIPGAGVRTLNVETAALRVLNGPGSGRVFPLGQTRMVVGRNDLPTIQVDIDLTDCELGSPPAVSRRHAELQWVAGRLEIADLGSTNGTSVNERRLVGATSDGVAEAVTLSLGDQITLANLQLEVVTDG